MSVLAVRKRFFFSNTIDFQFIRTHCFSSQNGFYQFLAVLSFFLFWWSRDWSKSEPRRSSHTQILFYIRLPHSNPLWMTTCRTETPTHIFVTVQAAMCVKESGFKSAILFQNLASTRTYISSWIETSNDSHGSLPLRESQAGSFPSNFRSQVQSEALNKLAGDHAHQREASLCPSSKHHLTSPDCNEIVPLCLFGDWTQRFFRRKILKGRMDYLWPLVPVSRSLFGHKSPTLARSQLSLKHFK